MYLYVINLDYKNIILLQVFLENIQLNLIEDRPPVNITSPGSVPVNLNFGRLNVKRDSQGIFHIQPIGNRILILIINIVKVFFSILK